MAIFLTHFYGYCTLFLVLGGGGYWREGNPEILVITFENVLLGFWLSMKNGVLIAKHETGCVLWY